MNINAWCRIIFSIVALSGFLPVFASAGTLAQFRTVVGEIDVELFDQDKPLTVSNFIRYINSGSFTNFQLIHRWVPGFVIQGGGFFVKDPGTTNQDFFPIPNFGTITNEFSVGPRYSNLYGTIAMARSAETNSATSQWFINLGDNSSLDADKGGFTVFGRVVEGTNTLNKFNAPFTNNIFRINLGSPLNELPVDRQSIPTRTVLFDSLLYVDITLLRVEVATLANAGREISWNSVSNKLNVVEFTTSFPPIWQTLTSTNGDGSRFRAIDTSPSRQNAFYRVRVQ
jgi:peptidyl-prolyl cis-trans isomerase A (cyclophilin A)